MSYFDFHIHSHYSSDSRMIPAKIIQVALNKGLKGIAITDHNTIKGAIEGRKNTSSDELVIIVGSEIRTTLCELIGLFLTNEISSTDPLAVIDEIENQGGITVLPHPFRSVFIPHNKIRKEIPPEIIKRIHVIETVNSRTRERDNLKARILASQNGKSQIAGSDAHFYPEIGRGRTLVSPFRSEEELKKNILEGRTQVEFKSNAFLKGLPFQFLGALSSRVPR